MTAPLEAFGIRPGQDVRHGAFADPREFEPQRFFDQALPLLEKVSPVVMEDIVPALAEQPEKPRWNPGGFIVFPLGLTEDRSSLRLHVSPKGLSRAVLDGPFIHNHGWQLASRVIGGTYSDIIFQVQKISPEEAEVTGDDIFQLFETQRGEGGKDNLVTNGTLVKATPIQERKVSAGNTHTIEAVTVYHLPTTPADEFAATLVLDSPAFMPSTHVLFARNYQPKERVRKQPSRDEIEMAKEQLSSITAI